MLKFAVGLFLGMSLSVAMADMASDGYEFDEENGYMAVDVPTNGVLRGYVVLGKDGSEQCRNPMVFKAQEDRPSTVFCDWQ